MALAKLAKVAIFELVPTCPPSSRSETVFGFAAAHRLARGLLNNRFERPKFIAKRVSKLAKLAFRPVFLPPFHRFQVGLGYSAVWRFTVSSYLAPAMPSSWGAPQLKVLAMAREMVTQKVAKLLLLSWFLLARHLAVPEPSLVSPQLIV